MRAKRFPANILTAIREAKILGIRAGTEPHRIIGIWAEEHNHGARAGKLVPCFVKAELST